MTRSARGNLRSVNNTITSSSGLPAPEKLLKLNYYRGEDRHEWSLLSHRLSSYVTSQSFLMTSYAVAMGNSNPKWSDCFTLLFLSLVAILGLVTSWLSYPGIAGAMQILELWHRKERQLALADPTATTRDAPRDAAMDDFLDGRPLTRSPVTGEYTIDEIHDRSLRFAVAAPWLFGVAWALLLVLAFGFYFMK